MGDGIKHHASKLDLQVIPDNIMALIATDSAHVRKQGESSHVHRRSQGQGNFILRASHFTGYATQSVGPGPDVSNLHCRPA